MRRGYDRLEASLGGLIAALPEKPRAIVVVTAHWEEARLRVSFHPQPPMLYDYYGFPEHTYHIQYAAPGSPEWARRISGLLAQGGVACDEDDARGFDHGTFSLMQPIRPEADIPVVQLSLLGSLDPAAHLAIGRLLQPLREEGVLIIGSGLSYHNLRALGPEGAVPAAAFDQWLNQSLVGMPAAERNAALMHWAQAPAARMTPGATTSGTAALRARVVGFEWLKVVECGQPSTSFSHVPLPTTVTVSFQCRVT